jgi:hypothetical protein
MHGRLALGWLIVCCRSCGKGATGPAGAGAPLSQTIENSAFVFRFAAGDSVQVERQMAFHEWAVRTLGIPAPRRMKRLFGLGTPDDSANQVWAAVAAVYGASVEDLEREWLAFLDGG